LIFKGECEAAKACLGRSYSIVSKVVKGAGRGKDLGFPTANLAPVRQLMPPQGVYAVKVREVLTDLNADPSEVAILKYSDWVEGVLNYGYRPTFSEDALNVCGEVHLFDFNQDLYGKTLEVAFIRKIRSEQEFANVNELREQIEVDIDSAKRHLAAEYIS